MPKRDGAGRKPLPDALKLIRNPKTVPSRLNPDQPKFDNKIEVPAHFDEARKEAWFKFVPMLLKSHVVTEADVPALEILCEKYVEWRRAQDMCNKHGLIVRTPNGYPQMSPFYTASMQIGKELRSLLAEFGMTPSSRTKVVATDSGEKGGGEFDNI